MRRVVLGRGLVLAAVGVAGGLGISLASARIVRALLYGVTATDPVTLAVAAATLVLVTLLACWVPVRAATSIDPLVALRFD